jgi:CheY-like chemotaxis protein
MDPSLSVFVVDDEPHILRLYERTLSSRYAVRAFAGPTEALAAVLVEKPTCMIVDYRMPVMSGVELVRRCRAAGYEGGVLVVTAYADLDELAYASQTELVYRILPKPVGVDQLGEEVELVIADTRFRLNLEGRREHPRFSAPVALEVSWDGAWVEGKPRNVSLGGVLLDWRPEGRQFSQVPLRLRQGDGYLEVTGRLVHIGPYGTGLAFLDAPKSFRDALAAVITEFRFGQPKA